MTYSEMTDDQRLEWGREELAARKADLSLRTAEGLRDAKQRADARRRAICASKSAAASMVAEATRELRWAAYRTTASQPAAAPCAECGGTRHLFNGTTRVACDVCEGTGTVPPVHQPDAGRAYYETHEPPHCPSCRCGLDRHPGYVIGNHWLESAYERICAGEAEAEVLADYGVTRTADNSPADQEG